MLTKCFYDQEKLTVLPDEFDTTDCTDEVWPFKIVIGFSGDKSQLDDWSS